jgi:protein tyrosine phosphatase (PTP) superfamily phosphohydrolase (DUF442 family)
VRTVVNLRHEREPADFDERSLVAALGMRYENPAFGSADELTDEIFEETRELLRTAERPILLHCASASRAGAIWAAYLSLDEGLTWEAAVAEAKAAGLRSAALETRARAYVHRGRRAAARGALLDRVGDQGARQPLALRVPDPNGANDVAVPIVLAVAWAGNTPVVGVTDLDVPGLGTYTARVLFFRDKYAGTWSGRSHGGHLFGRIERPAGE